MLDSSNRRKGTTMSDYFNEAGEPYMDAAAMRLEQELDAQSAAERFEESWYDEDYYDECDEDHQCEDCGRCVDACVCDDRNDEPEDAWLDGSYEE